MMTKLMKMIRTRRVESAAVRSVGPNPVPALAKEWERNTVDLWRTETDPGVSMKRGTSLAGHGLKTKKRSRKQKLALLLTILLTAIRRMKTLCHCSKVRDSYDLFKKELATTALRACCSFQL